MRNWKREFAGIGESLPVLGLGAFLCAVGGVLVWVSGGSGWYLAKAAQKENLPGLTTLFVFWLLLYGLYGVLMAALFKEGRTVPFACAAGAYLLSLCWYAVFFCTRMGIFAAILLLLSVGALAAAFLEARRCPLLTRIGILCLILGELSCLPLTFMAIL